MKKSLIIGLALLTAGASAGFVDGLKKASLVFGEEKEKSFFSDTCVFKKHYVAVPGVALLGVATWDIIAEYMVAKDAKPELTFGAFVKQYLKEVINPANIRDGKLREARKIALLTTLAWTTAAAGTAGWRWLRADANKRTDLKAYFAKDENKFNAKTLGIPENTTEEDFIPALVKAGGSVDTIASFDANKYDITPAKEKDGDNKTVSFSMKKKEEPKKKK